MSEQHRCGIGPSLRLLRNRRGIPAVLTAWLLRSRPFREILASPQRGTDPGVLRLLRRSSG